VNTELRELSDPRVFDYVDFVTLDNGEAPFLRILRDPGRLLRTFVREGGRVVFKTFGSAGASPSKTRDKHISRGMEGEAPAEPDIPHCETGTPSFRGLKLNQYISLCEMLNPMHRLWSDGRWNKLIAGARLLLAKCAFCDTSLDYIHRFDPASADVLVDRIEALVRETGERGFHFTDEAVAAGPASGAVTTADPATRPDPLVVATFDSSGASRPSWRGSWRGRAVSRSRGGLETRATAPSG